MDIFNEFNKSKFRKSFFDSAAELEFKGEIHVDVPVSILHGVKVFINIFIYQFIHL